MRDEPRAASGKVRRSCGSLVPLGNTPPVNECAAALQRRRDYMLPDGIASRNTAISRRSPRSGDRGVARPAARAYTQSGRGADAAAR